MSEANKDAQEHPEESERLRDSPCLLLAFGSLSLFAAALGWADKYADARRGEFVEMVSSDTAITFCFSAISGALLGRVYSIIHESKQLEETGDEQREAPAGE